MARFISVTLAISAIIRGVFWFPYAPQWTRVDQPDGDWEIRQISPFDSPHDAIYSHPSISSTGNFIAYLTTHLEDQDTRQQSITVYSTLNEQVIQTIPIPAGEDTEVVLISPNGRYVVMQTRSITEGAASSLQVFDRLTGSFTDSYVSASISNIKTPISYDGRYLLVEKQDSGALIMIDRFTGQESILFHPSVGGTLSSAAIASSSRWVGFSVLEESGAANISIFDRIFQTTQQIYSQESQEIRQLSISSNGSWLAFTILNNEGAPTGIILNNSSDPASIAFTLDHPANLLLTSQLDRVVSVSEVTDGFQIANQPVNKAPTQPLPLFAASTDLAVDAQGDKIVYIGAQDGVPAVYLAYQTPVPPGQTYSGQVNGAYNSPLGTVTVTLGDLETRTDQYGLFYFEHVTEISEIQFFKEGYSFSRQDETGDHISTIAVPDDVIEEAALDIGMPYSFDRGCPSPFEPCDGPYHGFYSGYCTDLIYDAYLWGANYNIQSALAKDAINNPAHFYRWRDARNAHDMWRYFAYTNQMIWENGQYAIGDIVFFDWEGNSEIDHVALVSEVRSNGMPRLLLDATGVINSNPSGRAAELGWEDFHDATVRGHARWDGLFTAKPIIRSESPVLQTSILAAGVNASYYTISSEGNRLSNDALGEPIGLVWETVNSFPAAGNTARYYVNLSFGDNPTTPTHISGQIFDDGLIPNRSEFNFDLTSGLFHRLIFTTNNTAGEIEIGIVRIEKSITGPVVLSTDQP